MAVKSNVQQWAEDGLKAIKKNQAEGDSPACHYRALGAAKFYLEMLAKLGEDVWVYPEERLGEQKDGTCRVEKCS